MVAVVIASFKFVEIIQSLELSNVMMETLNLMMDAQVLVCLSVGMVSFRAIRNVMMVIEMMEMDVVLHVNSIRLHQ